MSEQERKIIEDAIGHIPAKGSVLVSQKELSQIVQGAIRSAILTITHNGIKDKL